MQVHPVHKTFLFFHQAVCYESLGHISHNYSSNKIPLFEQARDAFTSASEALPLPFLTTPDGLYDAPGSSPGCATFDVLELYKAGSPSVYSVPSPFKQTPYRHQSTSAVSPLTTEPVSRVPVVYTVPDFDDYSPRQPMKTGPSVQQPLGNGTNICHTYIALTLRQRARSRHKARLSRSLSSQHALAEHLVPSPLFSRGPASNKESQSDIATDIDSSLSLVACSKPLPPTPVNRDLPALPFNHHARFVLKGKRLLIVPRRKTALTTFISRFEGRSPFDSPTPADSTGKEIVLVEPTPTTARFKRISSTFAEKQDSDSHSTTQPQALGEPKNFNQKMLPRRSSHSQHSTNDSQKPLPSTPCPKPRQQVPVPQPPPSSHHIHTPIPTSSTAAILFTPPQSSRSSSHLQAYNAHLSSLRTLIKSHITNITTKITQTSAVQLAHEDEKRRRFANMHSYSHNRQPHSHSRSSVGQLEPTSPTNRKTRDRDSRPHPSKDARLRSFWNLQIKDAQRQNRSDADGVDEEKRKRIERLRGEGWKSVTKERCGWKGSEYYERLRGQAEQDLDLEAYGEREGKVW